ncbi:hypothetical protein BDR06DRAFT_1011708 [Suillus hirtellus]|nr:hypothetical protein BDR06DRAFT_1011708 [Suillus hirtellus]
MPAPQELTTHRLHPYSRASSTHSYPTQNSSSTASGSIVSPAEKKRKKVYMNDVDLANHPAIIWARSRMIMDLVATKGWMKNETTTEKELMNIYLGEIIAQANSLFHRDIPATKTIKSLLKYGVSQFRNHLAVTAEHFMHLHNLEPKQEDNLSDSACKAFMMALRTQIFDLNQPWTYFLHRQELTADSIILLLFGNIALEETHLEIWYGSKYSPFRNMNMRAEIKTTMPLMLSESAAGAQCAIDRAVEGCLADSHKGVPHFSAKLYASRQAVYHNAILASLADPLHKESLEAHFLALHRRGLALTDTTFGTVLFPTYEELYQQLYHTFPISHIHYISKLIFSPDMSKTSHILIGKEVHDTEEYNTRIAPLHRCSPNLLLRFSIFDETPHKALSAMVEDSWEVLNPLSFMAIPPLPTLLSTPPPPNLSSTSSFNTHFQEFLSFKAAHPLPPSSRPLPTLEGSYLAPQISPLFISPPPPIIFSEPPTLSRHPSIPSLPSLSYQAGSPKSCCSVAKGKSKMETLLTSFRKDIDHIILDTFGECDASAQADTSHRQTPFGAGAFNEAPHASSEASFNTMNISMEPVSSHWCFICRNEFSGSWYGCVKCPWHYVCPSCFSKSGAMHTFSFGPTHVVQQHETVPSIAITPSATEISAESQSTRTELVGSSYIFSVLDYDLCMPCIESGTAERHNPFHEFFDIEVPGRALVHTVFSGSGECDVSPNSGSAIADSPRTPVATPVSTIETICHCAACNLCDSPIVGDRFMSQLSASHFLTTHGYPCVNCPDFETCADCFKITGEQHPYHSFLWVSKPSDLVMRNAVANRTTHYATCDAFRETIRGVHYKCMHPSCPDFDLCQNCEALPIPVHPSIHPLLKMKTPDTVIPTVYRVGMTNVIHSRRTSQGSTPPETFKPRPPKSLSVSVSCTSSEISMKKEEEPSLVPKSLSPLAILAHMSRNVSSISDPGWHPALNTVSQYCHPVGNIGYSGNVTIDTLGACL